MCEKVVARVSNYLKVPVGELGYNGDNIIEMKTKDSKFITGFSTILNSLHSKSESPKNKKTEEYFLVKQFFDYSYLFVKSSRKDRQQFCVELNTFLESRSYLIGHNVTVADVVMFHSMFDQMQQFPPQDKESYVNLSRWFDHLQQFQELNKGDSPKVNFTTVGLHRA